MEPKPSAGTSAHGAGAGGKEVISGEGGRHAERISTRCQGVPGAGGVVQAPGDGRGQAARVAGHTHAIPVEESVNLPGFPCQGPMNCWL